MPSRVTRDDAARIAALAKLEMTAPELDRAARELDTILDHFDALDAVDISAIALDAQTTARAPLRGDAPAPSLSAEDAFANAPDADRGAGLFRVPRVLGS